MDLDQLREFEELIHDAISRGDTLAGFGEYVSGLVAAKELHLMRPDLGVDAIIEDVRKYLWEEKRK